MAAQVINVFTRTLCWTAGVVDGLLEALLGALSGDQMSRLGRADPTLAPLRAALLGRHRRQIARTLGTPPTACAARGEGPRTYWEASTWYYPCDVTRHEAIAIRFVNDRARNVELIRAPR